MAFEHLSLPRRVTGGGYNSPYGKGEGKRTVVVEKNQRTVENERNRSAHGANLLNLTTQISENWQRDAELRAASELPELPASKPLFFQVDPERFAPESLTSFGIEVISEEEDGYLIGATADLNLVSLTEKIERFLSETGRDKNQAALLWNIIDGKQWRINHILSPELLERWDNIADDERMVIDVSIACYVRVSEFPIRQQEEEDDHFEKRENAWQRRVEAAERERDDLAFERQDELRLFVENHGGSIISEYVESADSFSCRVQLSGTALKDLVFNYPYIFEADEYDDCKQSIGQNAHEEEETLLEIVAPSDDSPVVCVVDSGIQEGHRLLQLAIDSRQSLSYVPGESDVTSDQVENGGHGTKVAGAVLYPSQIPTSGVHQLNVRLQNARVLNGDNFLDEKLYPAELMKDIVDHFNKTYNTRLFNMSIASKMGHRATHMSKWAESLDRQIFENDILFILPTGNINSRSYNRTVPGIKDYLEEGKNYPDYLFDHRSRVANPSHSLFSLTVGSVCHSDYENDDVVSFGKTGHPSAFTRTGLGIWGSIKPEVVEFGGDFAKNKSESDNTLYEPDDISISVVRSTLSAGPAVGKGNGTSFAAPKVTSIVGTLQKLFPDESTLLYKALIIQSARWPAHIFSNPHPELDLIRAFGYGIPNLERATTNSDYRATLVNSGFIAPKQADVYEIRVPENLRRQGDAFDILVEVTLTFKALPRRTRSGFRSYLSGWVDWHSSKLGESQEVFAKRLIVQIDKDQIELNESNGVTNGTEDVSTIPWTLRTDSNRGMSGVKLNHSATQKDWVKLKSYQLTESFCIAVVGHKGWEKDIRKSIPYSIAVSFEALNKDLEIYEDIRVHNEVELRVDV